MKIIFASALCLTAVLWQTAQAESYFGTEGVCYARQYSVEHMQENPNQTVAYIRFDHYGYDGDVAEFKLADGALNFDLIVQFRDSEYKFGDVGKCGADGDTLECAIECDGGQFDVKRQGKNSILLYNKYGLRVTGCANDETIREVSIETDDKVFLLHRMPVDQCVSGD